MKIFLAAAIPVLMGCLGTQLVWGQPLNGTTGLLNVPSADMQAEGTLFLGANYLPDAVTPADFDYNTGNYYFNITFLPFFEFNYRMTLLKMPTGNYNQDRSFGMRFRLLREKEILPALVIGGNDLYSSSGLNSTYFNSLYAVSTKNFNLGSAGSVGVSAGYAHQGFGKQREGNMKGLFGGVTFSPGFYKPFRLIGEYDSRAVNIGASVLLFHHLFLFGMLHELRTPAAGFALFFRL
jgi:hypothetical protein